MVGYILVYLQNITSIDAESGLSCDTTALKSPLSGGDLTAAYQTPSAPAFRVGCDFDVRSTTVRDVVTADIQPCCS